MLNSLVASPVPPHPLLPPRRRGGQPSNRNAFKHGLYAHKRPAPLTRFSNSLPGYADVIFQTDPAVLGRLISNLNTQINWLVGLGQSFVERGDTTSYCAWHKVFHRTINISMYIKTVCHDLQQPFQDLQYVSENALALIFYEFR